MIGAFEPVAADEVGLDPARLDLARAMVHDQVATGRAPTAAAVVLRHGRIVLAEAAGAQRPDGPPLTIDHVWPLASAGKPFTAAVIMSLAEQGLVGIDEPAATVLPELADEPHVMVHHLLTHTSGWESPLFTGRMHQAIADNPPDAAPSDTDPWRDLMRALAFDRVRTAEIGTQMAYGNHHYELLAEIVRRVTGDTLDAAMQTRLLGPLGMADTAVIVPPEWSDRMVERDPALPFGSAEALPGINAQGAAFRRADIGAAGVMGSPLDLAVFGQMILDGGSFGDARVLAPSTVEAMTTNRIPGTPAEFGPGVLIPEASWGYGFSVICEQRWPWFGGGLVPLGSVTHPGAGGINYWVDFAHGIVGVWFEVITEMSPMFEPVSGRSHRFQDVITAAVVG